MVGIAGLREAVVEFYGFYRPCAPPEDLPCSTHAYGYHGERAERDRGRVEGTGEERRPVVSARALEGIC
jgi:hypothetical protein